MIHQAPCSSPLVRTAALAVLLALAGCASNRYTPIVKATPPEATVFVNGIKVGQGAPIPHTFDFSQCERIYVQAAHPDYEPFFQEYTELQMQQIVDAGLQVSVHMRAR
jgi:hypothetical protein